MFQSFLIFFAKTFNEKFCSRMGSPMQIAALRLDLFGSIPRCWADSINFKRNEGTVIKYVGLNLRMESHCNSGIPDPTRMIPAPNFRAPKKYAKPAINLRSMVVINCKTSSFLTPAHSKEIASLYAKQSRSLSDSANVTGSPNVPEVVT